MPDTIIVPLGAPLELTATVDGSPEVDQLTEATFEVFKLDKDKPREVLATIKGTITARKAEAKWEKASGPGDDEMAALVHYGVKAGDLAFDGDEDIVVYRDTIEIKAVDANNAKVPDTLFRITSNRGSPDQSYTTRRADAEGVAVVKRLPPGEIAIECVDPYELRGWVKADGPKRTATVARRTYKAEFAFPQAGTTDHEQIVNLEQRDQNPEWGHTMKVKVAVKGGAAGVTGRLYLKAVFKASERNAPARTIVGGVQNGLTSTHDLPIGPDGTATFDVELGHGGGDEATISCGSTDQCADGTFKVVNWRKVFYQLTAPDIWNVNALPGPVQQAMDDEYEKAFIRLEQHQIVAWDSNTNPIHNMRWVRGNRAIFKTAFDPIVFLVDQSPGFRDFLGDISMFPRMIEYTSYLQFAFVSHLADSFPQEDYDLTMTGRTSGWVPTSGERILLGIVPADMVVNATMTWTATGAVDATPFDPAWLDIDADAQGKRFKVRLPPTLAGGNGGGPSRSNPLKVSLRLKAIKTSAAGRSSGTTIATGWKPHAPRQMAFTLVHELGHTFNQSIVADRRVPGLDVGDHDTRYGTGTGEGEHGHSGSHCRKGLSKPFWSSANYSKVYSKWGAHGDCVMWGGALKEKHSNSAFCDKCMRFLKACEL